MKSLRKEQADCPCNDEPANGALLDVVQAVRRAAAIARPIGRTEMVGISAARGRMLARTLHAARAMPFFDNSAMDGFAVRFADFSGSLPLVLPVDGECAAGAGHCWPLKPGTCRRIYTGARIPEGADTVIPLEHVHDMKDKVLFASAPVAFSHIRRKGSDIARNAVLVEQGTKIEPRHIGLIAANGYSAVNVVARPRAGVFSTGDEVEEAGRRLAAGQLYDSNRPMLVAALEEAGCNVCDLGVVRDDPQSMRDFLAGKANGYDLLVSSGSVSVGARDFLKDALVSVGGHIVGWKVAMKPGKPVLFGRIGEAAYLGLPGNPFAAWVGFQLFAKAMIRSLAGSAPARLNLTTGKAGCEFPHRKGRAEFVPVRVAELDGAFHVDRIGNGSSATMYAIASADAVAVMDAGTGDVHCGEQIRFLPMYDGEFS